MNPLRPGFVFIWDGFLCKVVEIVGLFYRVGCYNDDNLYWLDYADILRLLGRP